MPSFNYAPKADTIETHLIGTIPMAVWKKLNANWYASGRGTSDKEKGYVNDDITFRDEKGRVFNVYTRWGVPRLGGCDLTTDDLNDFVEWATKIPVFPHRRW